LLFEEGRFESALQAFVALYETRFPEARARGFDFSRDYRLLNRIGLTWLEIARQSDQEARLRGLNEAADWFHKALVQDPENAAAHYNLSQVYRLLGQIEQSAFHAAEHDRYRIDDNARDRAIAAARRRDRAADHAADPVVIHDLHRDGADVYRLRAPEVIQTMARQ